MGLCSSDIWLLHAAAGSPLAAKYPLQNSFPGNAFPSQAYVTTRSLFASVERTSLLCGSLNAKCILISVKKKFFNYFK